jgi:hypothetical protein
MLSYAACPSCCPAFPAENFKFSRLVLQAWLQSAPELVLIGIILYRNVGSGGPAVVINGTILLQVRDLSWFNWSGVPGDCILMMCSAWFCVFLTLM